MYEQIPTKNLPLIIKRVLLELRLPKRRSMTAVLASSCPAYSAGDDGARGFVVTVNLTTKQYDVVFGAWGGGGLGRKPSIVDDTTGGHRIPLSDDIVVLKGQLGGRDPYAMIYMTPEIFQSLTNEPVLRLAANKDQEWPMTRIASFTRIAHNPITNTLMYEKLINPRSYAEGMAKMMHLIDPERNHSKFYEMVIIPAGNGQFKLLKVWGRLTDTGRIGRLVEDHPTLASALNSMAAKTREELRKGYKDTFLTNRGQYPIGLGGVSGLWQGQDAKAITSELRKLREQIDIAIEAGLDDDRESMSAALADMGRVLFDLPESTMAKELLKRLKAPTNALLGTEGYKTDAKAIARNLKTVRTYLDNQLSEIVV